MVDTSAAKYRTIQRLQPGHWWEGTYLGDDGTEQVVWAQVRLRLHLQQATTGRKVIRVLGTDTTGEAVELYQYPGYQVLSLTARQGEKAGLRLPERDATPDTESAPTP